MHAQYLSSTPTVKKLCLLFSSKFLSITPLFESTVRALFSADSALLESIVASTTESTDRVMEESIPQTFCCPL